MPLWRKRSITSVAVEPTGSNVARDRDARLDRADVVVVEDLDDLGVLDADDALRLLGVVDQQHAPRLAGSTRSERVTRPTGRRRPSTTTAAR